jgi:hypothetical protein
MRRLLLAAVAAVCVALPASSRADAEYREGADWMRTTALPCTDEKVLQHIPEAERKDWRAGKSEVGGKPYAVCWKPLFAQQVILMKYEDGDAGLVPFSHLKPVKSV